MVHSINHLLGTLIRPLNEVAAGQAGNASEQISSTSQSLSQAANEQAASVEETSASKLFDAIVPGIAKTSELVQEIANASLEQSFSAGQVSTAINQINQITQQNAAASEELAATAEEMTFQAEQLKSLIGFFKITGTQIFFKHSI